jgi:hypothetical protein
MSGGGGDPPFYKPYKESIGWSVKDPDMSGKEPEHI